MGRVLKQEFENPFALSAANPVAKPSLNEELASAGVGAPRPPPPRGPTARATPPPRVRPAAGPPTPRPPSPLAGLPPEPAGLRTAIRQFVDSYEYWTALVAALKGYQEAATRIADADAELGRLLSTGVIPAGRSPALQSGVFGQAGVRCAELRARAARDTKKHFLDQARGRGERVAARGWR